MKKIEDKELQQLKDLQSKNSQIIIELGEIEYNKLLLKKKTEFINKQIDDLFEEEKTLKEFLISKYGDNININIETGEY